jgi:hypothetical protein
MGTPLAGSDAELTVAPLIAAIFKNEVLEATTVLTLSAFQSETTATVSITVTAGDRISVRLMETTPGTTWRGFTNFRFVFDSLHRGTVIGGGTGTTTISGATVGSWRMYPSLSDIDAFVDSGIARATIPVDSQISEFYVYRYPAIYSQFKLSENENELFTITVTGIQNSSIPGDRITMPENTYLAVDLLTVSGLISISWSALLSSI